MAVTTAMIQQLRRMTNEPAADHYPDSIMAAYLERYPLLDALGHPPYVKSSTLPVTLVVNTEWTPTYDLNAAAADIWDEKAAALEAQVDFSSDGASFSLSQRRANAAALARSYRSRRAASGITLLPTPRPTDAELPEDE